MTLLDQLWDDTVAGPRPESGLGRLRKQAFRSSAGKESDGGNKEETTKVTRRIMIVKPPSPRETNENGSPPISPASSTPPVSPFAGRREAYLSRRRSMSDAYEKANGIGARGAPTSHDV